MTITRWFAVLGFALTVGACAASVRPRTSHAEEIGGTTGAPECDEYLWKLKACAEHEAHLESTRAAELAEYRRLREAWANVPARDPETRVSIIRACTDGIENPSPSYENMCPGVF